MVTAVGWERPEGAADVQQRGTALTQGVSKSQGEEHVSRVSTRLGFNPRCALFTSERGMSKSLKLDLGSVLVVLVEHLVIH